MLHIAAAELKADAESIFVREAATISAEMNDDNGIRSYTAILDGEKAVITVRANGEDVTLDSNGRSCR